MDYLGFECLAERTIALAQGERLRDPQAGFDPLLVARMEAVLRPCAASGVRIITNMGAANPIGGREGGRGRRRGFGLSGLKIAAVGGDDVLSALREGDYPLLERPGTVADLGDRVVSANAYMGVAGIVEALGDGADVVVTGRVGDPALFLAPLIHEFGWALDDWDRLGTGHRRRAPAGMRGPDHRRLLRRPRLQGRAGPRAARLSDRGGRRGRIGRDHQGRRLGRPGQRRHLQGAAAVRAAGPGRVPPARRDRRFLGRAVRRRSAPNRVAVSGGTGRARPETLKVSVGYRDSFIGEGQISYAGPGAVARARLALEIVRERLRLTGVGTTETRFELIGMDAVRKGGEPEPAPDLREVRLRVAARTDSMAEAVRVGNEVESLYTNGPAGGGGAWKSARQIVAVVSTLLPQHLAQTDRPF